MVWRRSQKVKCISNIYEHMTLPPCVPYTPKLDDVCTIDTIDPYPAGERCENLGDCVQLRFVELPNPVCDCMGAPATFCSCRFRPLVENEQTTDISILVDAAAKVTLPKREDVKATNQANAIIAHGGAVLRVLRQQRMVLGGDRPGEAVMTPEQVAVMNSAVDKAADDITREFVRTFVIPWLVKRLGL